MTDFLSTTEKKETINVDGKTYERSGKCNRCGDCCPGCPHLIKNEEGLFACAIWEKLDEKDDPDALKAGIHSSRCKNYPNSPVDLNISEKCEFRFNEIK